MSKAVCRCRSIEQWQVSSSYFQQQSLLRSRETGLAEVLTKEANTAVKFWRRAKWSRRLKMQVHTFHTRAKSEDRHVCS